MNYRSIATAHISWIRRRSSAHGFSCFEACNAGEHHVIGELDQGSVQAIRRSRSHPWPMNSTTSPRSRCFPAAISTIYTFHAAAFESTDFGARRERSGQMATLSCGDGAKASLATPSQCSAAGMDGKAGIAAYVGLFAAMLCCSSTNGAGHREPGVRLIALA